jgi:tetratricopeptide (TPR) repeat protein
MSSSSPSRVELERARGLMSLRRFPEAEHHLRLALTHEPENFDANMTMALLYFRTQRMSESIQMAERSIALDPHNDWPHRLLSFVHAAKTKPDNRAALSCAERAIQLQPEIAANYVALSNAHSNMGRKGRVAAIEAAQKAVELDAEDSVSHLTLGNALLHTKRLNEAEYAYRMALHLDPEDNAARSNLALVLRTSGRAEEALPLVRSNLLDAPGEQSHMQELLQTATAHVKDGPVTKFYNQMLRLAILRVPILIAMVVYPFAKLEQRQRIQSLPPEVQGALSTAKARTRRSIMRYFLIGAGIAVPVSVVLVAVLELLN